jgi:GTP-binding protein HflX
VRTILNDLGIKEDAPMFEVWNKIDLLDGEAREARLARAAAEDDKFAISAITGEGVPELLAAISGFFEEEKIRREFVIPYSEGKKRAWLFEQQILENEEATEDGYAVTVLWTPRQEQEYRDM